MKLLKNSLNPLKLFAFDGVNYLYYDLNKISISKGGSYIDSPKWLNDKKSTINPKNNDYKCLSSLLTGITSNHKKGFYCLNSFHSYRTKSKLEAHKKICENRDYCRAEIPTKDNNTIKYNHGEKSIKLPFVVYADLESLLEKMSPLL